MEKREFDTVITAVESVLDDVRNDTFKIASCIVKMNSKELMSCFGTENLAEIFADDYTYTLELIRKWCPWNLVRANELGFLELI